MLVDRVIDSMQNHASFYRLEVYLFDRDELLDYGKPGEIA